MITSVSPELFKSLTELDINSLLQYPPSCIRSLLPCLTRMLLCSSLDKSNEWEEKQKDLMQLLSGIEDVNDLVALLAIDFHALEIDAKTEQRTRQKIGSDGKSIVTSNLQKHGLILEFERCEPVRKLRLLISDMMPLFVSVSNSGDSFKLPPLDKDGYASKSELFCCISYLEIVSDVLCIAVAELPTLLNMLNVAEALMYVPNGGEILCKLVANNSSSIISVCQSLIKYHTTEDNSHTKSVLRSIEDRRKNAIESICAMKPDIASHIRALTVQYCKMPSLAISLTLNHIMNSESAYDGRVSELVTFVSGLLLGSNTRTRSWFASFIKTTQDIHPNYLRKELEKELRAIVVSSEMKQDMSMDSRQDSLSIDEDLIDTMCLLNEEQCLRATTLIRLCCALKAIAGLKFSEVESDLVLRLITCFPPLTAAGIRFMSLSLSMLLACSAFIVDQDKEKRSINWIKWLASRSSELQNAGPEGGSFAEQLLLMAIHLHSDQRHAVAQLACSTLGMKIKVPTSSLTRMRQIFTEEVFTTQVVAAHAVNVPVTKSLNASMTGYLPIHCVYQLLKSRAFSKSRVSIKEWIYKQICTTTSPLHSQLPSLVRQYVSTVVTPHTKGHDEGMLNDPLTEEEIILVFADKGSTDGSMETNAQEPTLTSQLLILYYVLLYEDSVLNHMKTLVTLPSAPKRYPSSLINIIPVKLLLHRAQREPQACDRLYPALLGLLATHLPHLCQVEDWISELDMLSGSSAGTSSVQSSDLKGDKEKKMCSPDLLYHGLSHADVNPALALMNLRTLTSARIDSQVVIPYAEPLTKGLSKLLAEDVSRRVKQEACKLWLKLNSVIPCKLWVLTCNALRMNPSLDSGFVMKQQEITLDNLVEDPLMILALDDRIFRSPEILSIILRMVGACLAASRVHYSALVKSNPSSSSLTSSAIPTRSDTPTFGSTQVSDNEKEELCNALVSAQDSAAIQILIEACLPTAKDWEVAGLLGTNRKDQDMPVNLLTSLREVHCLICSTLHQMFIADTKVAKLVHFQGYPSELIPVFVGGVPSMHICLDFIPELLQQQNIGKQLFAIQLASHLSIHYPLPKSLSIARLCVNVLSTLVTVLPAHQRCEFFSLALSSLRRFSKAFPPLLRNCISILIHLSRISKCHLAAHDSLVPGSLELGGLSEPLQSRTNQKSRDDHDQLHRDVRKTFNHIVNDALSKS